MFCFVGGFCCCCFCGDLSTREPHCPLSENVRTPDRGFSSQNKLVNSEEIFIANRDIFCLELKEMLLQNISKCFLQRKERETVHKIVVQEG